MKFAILAGAVSAGVGARLPHRPTARCGKVVAVFAPGFRALRHCGGWPYAPLADETGTYLAA